MAQKQRIIANPQDYLSLKGRQHGTYSYPNLAVGLHRLGASEQIPGIPRYSERGHEYMGV